MPTEQDFAPRTPSENLAAMEAVAKERRRAEDDALVKALTYREMVILDEAWRRGANEARTDLAKRLASPHAVTLSAESVASVVRAWVSDVQPIQFVSPDWHHDERVVRVVRYLQKLEERAS